MGFINLRIRILAKMLHIFLNAKMYKHSNKFLLTDIFILLDWTS